jgi:hypothetical protein
MVMQTRRQNQAVAAAATDVSSTAPNVLPAAEPDVPMQVGLSTPSTNAETALNEEPPHSTPSDNPKKRKAKNGQKKSQVKKSKKACENSGVNPRELCLACLDRVRSNFYGSHFTT